MQGRALLVELVLAVERWHQFSGHARRFPAHATYSPRTPGSRTPPPGVWDPPFLWSGRDLYAWLVSSLDFLHESAALVECFGPDYPWRANPFALPCGEWLARGGAEGAGGAVLAALVLVELVLPMLMLCWWRWRCWCWCWCWRWHAGVAACAVVLRVLVLVVLLLMLVAVVRPVRLMLLLRLVLLLLLVLRGAAWW